MLRTKGPAERLAFPSVSQSSNPFVQMGSILLILGRKIDNSMAMKDMGLCHFPESMDVMCIYIYI